MLAGRIGHLLGSTAPGAEGVGAGIRLPAVLPLFGRIAILARDDWAGLTRVPTVLDTVLGGSRRPPVQGGKRGKGIGRRRRSRRPGWRSARRPIDGVGSLAATYADLVDATRTAQRLGLRGWIADPEQLALERLLLADRELADATVRRELGPLLADERLGGAHRDAPGLLRCGRERDRGGATPPPGDADGGLPAGEDRVAARPSARRRGRPPPLDGAAGQAAAGRLAVIAAALRGAGGESRSAQHRRGTTEAQRGPRQFNG